MAKYVTPSAIALEVLNKDNYEDWSNLVQTYLLAHDLWDVVEIENESPSPEDGEAEEFKACRKKNAAALHAIKISCGPDAFLAIRDVKGSAKEAWHILESKFKRPPILPRKSSNEQRIEEENKKDESHEYKPFFDAVLAGDWQVARSFYTQTPDVLAAKIPNSEHNSTALHLAVAAKSTASTEIVHEMVQLMPEKALEIQDCQGMTALAVAVKAGRGPCMAEPMVRKNRSIVSIPDDIDGSIPVVMAVCCDNWRMACYLYSVTSMQDLMPEKGTHGATLISKSIQVRNFDFALQLLWLCPRLAITKDRYGNSPVYELACARSMFRSGHRLKFWQRWIYDRIPIKNQSSWGAEHIQINVRNLEKSDGATKRNNINSGGRLQGPTSNLLNLLGVRHIYKMKLAHDYSLKILHLMRKVIKELDDTQMENGLVHDAILAAFNLGNTEFVVKVITARPELWNKPDLWKSNTDDHKSVNRNMFMRATLSRQAEIFSLLHILGDDVKNALGDMEDRCKNNLLHMAGMLAPPWQLNQISGAALQMQRELQWFKEVETIVPPKALETINSDWKTPRELFTECHKELAIQGEKWIKETANSCTVVGALIVTMMFAAAFTVPGGNDGDTGLPIFLHKKLFRVFIVSDTISLFSSTTSVLMFLGILTSRYAEEDFLVSLPTKLIIGLSTLFLSIVTMMIAFCAVIVVMLHDEPSIITSVILLASVPVTLFIWMQFPLLVEIFISTYGKSFFDKELKMIKRLL